MLYDTAPSLRRDRPFLYRVYAALADMREAFAEFRRAQEDRECLMRLPEHQLHDIGLRRVAVRGVVRFLPLVEDGE
jgi:uncharacterized protein YjiS (DUF1127 family)